MDQESDTQGSSTEQPTTRVPLAVPGHEANRAINVPAPYATFPAWWRRFLFWLLKPREVVVYLYIATLLDRDAVAYPTQEQIANETALAATEPVIRALRVLVRLGFFLRGRARVPARSTRLQHRAVSGAWERTIYQRPSIEYTLIRLLDLGEIDGQLFPKGKAAEIMIDELDSTESAVALGLRNLLGITNYNSYMRAHDKAAALRSLLLSTYQRRTGVQLLLDLDRGA